MPIQLRRLIIAAASFVILFVATGYSQMPDPVNCGFCAEVCFDQGEYGMMMCGQRCGYPAVSDAECDWLNPCDPESDKPIWNVCLVLKPE